MIGRYSMRRTPGYVLASHIAAYALAAVLLAPPADAQEPGADEQTIRIAQLITRLGADSYLDRVAATEALATLGSETEQQLVAATAHDDPEVRARAKELLKQLKVDQLWTPRRVTIQSAEQPASQALAALGDQSGNRLLQGDQYGSFRDNAVELDSVDGQFWEVLDEVCRQSSNRVRPHYDTRSPGLVVVAGSPGRYPTAYAGPVRAQVTSARRVYTEELDYEEMQSEQTHTFQLNLQAMWEDRFRLVAYRSQPELVQAVTSSGAELSSTQPSGSGWNVAGTGTRQLTMNLRLHPPATTANSLALLKLKWGLIAVGDMAELVVADLANHGPHFQDDVELNIEQMETGPGARCQIEVRVLRDLIVPEPQEVIFQESELELYDQQGRPFRRQGQTNSLTESGARMKITFLGEASDSVPTTLKYIYPRIRSQHDLEIVFRDVPLPVGRPE